MEVAGHGGDLYTRLSDRAFPGGREEAKLALLGAVYGQTSGDGLKNLAALRRRFPRAVAYVDDAARAGEEGRLVRTWLGRAEPAGRRAPGTPARRGCPRRPARAPPRRTRTVHPGTPPSAPRPGPVHPELRGAGQCGGLGAAHAGRALRRATAGMRAELVFFQHDEVIVHCPAEEAEAVTESDPRGRRPGRSGSRSVTTPVRFPFTTAAVECYADAK